MALMVFLGSAGASENMDVAWESEMCCDSRAHGRLIQGRCALVSYESESPGRTQ